MVKIAKTHQKEALEMRKVYCQTLIDLSAENENIVVLDSDLMSSMGMIPYLKTYPERTFNCGVQEANMMGVAAGLSAVGKVPFAHTFGPFATRRSYDQTFMSGAYAKSNVRIVGSDPGVTAAFNGGTHMPFEDLGLMRNIPEMTVIIPTDGAMLSDIISQLSTTYGMYYIRLLRKNAIQIYEEGSTFEIGKAVEICDGNDVTLISNGIMTHEAIKATEMLESEGVSVKHLNMFTLKPIDADAIVAAANQTGLIVTCENHNIINGLGSAVSEVLAEQCPTLLRRVGVKDKFGQVGSVDYLKEVYELTAEDIVKAVKDGLKNKE